MSITQASNEQATRVPAALMDDMKFDGVVHPVSDADHAKRLLDSAERAAGHRFR